MNDEFLKYEKKVEDEKREKRRLRRDIFEGCCWIALFLLVSFSWWKGIIL